MQTLFKNFVGPFTSDKKRTMLARALDAAYTEGAMDALTNFDLTATPVYKMLKMKRESYAEFNEPLDGNFARLKAPYNS